MLIIAPHLPARLGCAVMSVRGRVSRILISSWNGIKPTNTVNTYQPTCLVLGNYAEFRTAHYVIWNGELGNETISRCGIRV